MTDSVRGCFNYQRDLIIKIFRYKKTSNVVINITGYLFSTLYLLCFKYLYRLKFGHLANLTPNKIEYPHHHQH